MFNSDVIEYKGLKKSKNTLKANQFKQYQSFFDKLRQIYSYHEQEQT